MSKLVKNQLQANVPNAWTPTFRIYQLQKLSNAEIWDTEGNRFLDYVGGYAVLNTGHVNPKVIDKVKEPNLMISHTLALPMLRIKMR